MARYKPPRKNGDNGVAAVGLIIGAAVLASGGGGAAASVHHSGHAAPATLAVAAGPAGSTVALGQQLASAYGWGSGPEWTCLYDLWQHESGWSATAQNPISTAYGIAQFLDTTWAPYGPKTSDPSLQIRYGLAYIHRRYGTPCGAWSFEMSHTPNWY